MGCITEFELCFCLSIIQRIWSILQVYRGTFYLIVLLCCCWSSGFWQHFLSFFLWIYTFLEVLEGVEICHIFSIMLSWVVCHLQSAGVEWDVFLPTFVSLPPLEWLSARIQSWWLWWHPPLCRPEHGGEPPSHGQRHGPKRSSALYAQAFSQPPPRFYIC